MGAKKILIIAGDFAEDYEVMVPFSRHCKWWDILRMTLFQEEING